MPKLDTIHKTFIVVHFAENYCVTEIQKRFFETFNVEIAGGQVAYYNPRYDTNLSPDWKELYAATRARFLAGVHATETAANPCVRISRLWEMAEAARMNGDYTDAADLLERARLEVEYMANQATGGSSASGMVVNIQNNSLAQMIMDVGERTKHMAVLPSSPADLIRELSALAPIKGEVVESEPAKSPIIRRPVSGNQTKNADLSPQTSDNQTDENRKSDKRDEKTANNTQNNDKTGETAKTRLKTGRIAKPAAAKTKGKTRQTADNQTNATATGLQITKNGRRVIVPPVESA